MLAARPDETRDEAWLQEVEQLGRPLTNLSAHGRHNAINLASLALLLAAFPASYLLLRPLPGPLGVVLLGLVYGTFIFSLFTLVVHEASHNQFLVTDSAPLRRRLNSAFGWIVCALFIRDYEVHWRNGHLLHHQRVLQDDDPQNCAKYVLERRDLIVKLAKVWLIPFYEFELYRLWMKGLDDRCPKAERSGASRSWVRTAAFGLGWCVILILPLREAPIATLVTVLIAIKAATALNFVKSSLEHGGRYRNADDERLKARGLTFPLRNLVFPFCITPFHWEHHVVPGIPWYRLPRFRRAIRDRIPEDRRDWIYTPRAPLLREVLLP